MNLNAISVANYFIDKATTEDTGSPVLDLLRIVKYVYIAYGFSLALLDRKIIDDRFDKVEAWKYGPVIPSVYHSFKHNQKRMIRDKAFVLVDESHTGEMNFEIPKIPENEVEVRMILDFVWDKYKDMDSGRLIELLHKDDTPWKYCYRNGANMPIPDEMTKVYYKAIVDSAVK